LDSIFPQIVNRNDVELVIVDDGSTDDTVEILRKFKEENKLPLRIITKENEGVGAARNLLIESAKGEYIWFVDSDDYIHKECISEILNIIDGEKYGDIFILLYREIKNKKFSKWIKYHSKLFQGTGLDYLSKRKPCIYGYLWNKIYRRDLIIDNGLSFDRILISQEDWLFNMKLFPSAKKIVETNICSYNYFLDNTTSTMHNKNMEHIRRNVSDSVSTQLDYNEFIQSYKHTKYFSQMLQWRNYAISGCLYSLFINKIDIRSIENYLSLYASRDMYPVGKARNFKSMLFLWLANIKSLYILLCRLHSC
jgi:glycosyltransferase involved in cell wall biosynthesis